MSTKIFCEFCNRMNDYRCRCKTEYEECEMSRSMTTKYSLLLPEDGELVLMKSRWFCKSKDFNLSLSGDTPEQAIMNFWVARGMRIENQRWQES